LVHLEEIGAAKTPEAFTDSKKLEKVIFIIIKFAADTVGLLSLPVDSVMQCD